MITPIHPLFVTPRSPVAVVTSVTPFEQVSELVDDYELWLDDLPLNWLIPRAFQENRLAQSTPVEIGIFSDHTAANNELEYPVHSHAAETLHFQLGQKREPLEALRLHQDSYNELLLKFERKAQAESDYWMAFYSDDTD